MLDSSSKIPSGILTGNVRDLGNFDECLAVEHTFLKGHFIGKHCMAKINLPEIGGIISPDGMATLPIQWSACVPDSCMASDLANVISRLEKKVNFKIPLTFADELCRSKSTQPKLNTEDIVTM